MTLGYRVLRTDWLLRIRFGIALPILLLLSNCFPPAIVAQQQAVVSGYIIGRGHRPLARLEPSKPLILELGLPLKSGTDLQKTVQSLYDPYSRSYRHFLTPEEFDRQFAPSPEDVRRVISYARSSALKVMGTPGGGMTVRVQGSVAAIEKAFKIELSLYQHPRETRSYFAPDVEPTLPPELPILHISGLDNFAIPRSLSVPQCKGASSLTAPPAGSYWGKAFRLAYAADASELGTGQVIGIIAFDGFYSADITAYEKMAGLPDVHVQAVSVDGFDGAPSCDNCEISMDMENAISMAPGISQLTVYEGGSDLDVLLEVAEPTQKEPLPNQVSTSYSLHYDQNMYNAMNRIAAQGQAFFVASGDFGAYTAYTGTASDNLPFPPADFPSITSVGGTELTVDSAGHWSSEDGWSGSGGGVSPWQPNDSNFDLPVYQDGIANKQNRASTVARNVPDVALTATNIAVLSGNGVWSLVGGTSSSAPLWAGFMALVNQQAVAKLHGPIGFPNGALYAIGKGTNYANAFHDIATGSNSISTDPDQYAAVMGYDLVTGWGTPHGQATIDAFVTVSTPSVSCADLQKALAFTQSQLQKAQNNLNSTLCQGPARFECTQTIKNLGQTLSEQEALYRQDCSKH
jgi:subtilase family serine protease